MSHRWRKVTLISILLVILTLLGISGYISQTRFGRFDPTLLDALRRVNTVSSYSERVDTTLFLSDRTLRVEGNYLIDAQNQRYASISTTTLNLSSSNTVISFSLSNITVGKKLYTRVSSTSTKRLSVPADGTWKTFSIDAIPKEYENIASAGPTLDTLKLFGKNGSYLTLVTRPLDVRSATTSLLHYTFKLAHSAIESQSDISSLVQRLGENGMIDLWIDPLSKKIRSYVFTNGGYHSTTTIESINEPLVITSPLSGNE